MYGTYKPKPQHRHTICSQWCPCSPVDTSKFLFIHSLSDQHYSHELGHSIIGVGEEYDGGFAYFGPNSAGNAQKLPWAHWLAPIPNGDHSPRIERSIMPFQAYPWTILNSTAPWRAVFHSSGTYARHLVRFSLSGLPAAHQLSVRLDGEDLCWVSLPGIGIDRWHYDIHRPDALSGGQHEILFELLDPDQEGIAQLCSIEILEYGTKDECVFRLPSVCMRNLTFGARFDARPGVYGVFPTYAVLCLSGLPRDDTTS